MYAEYNPSTGELLVTQTSQMTGRTNKMRINTTPGGLVIGLNECANGALIQNAFPTLAPDEREFLMTGITPEEWDALYADAPYPHSEVAPMGSN